MLLIRNLAHLGAPYIHVKSVSLWLSFACYRHVRDRKTSYSELPRVARIEGPHHLVRNPKTEGRYGVIEGVFPTAAPGVAP